MDIANTSGASAPTSSARLFDPAQWLARFVSMGGMYLYNGAQIWIGGPPEMEALVPISNEVLRDNAKREALKAHILATMPREALPC